MTVIVKSHDQKMADDPKLFLGLLNGVAKRTYYGEADITDELLKSELFSNLSDDEFNALLSRATGIIKVHCQKIMGFVSSHPLFLCLSVSALLSAELQIEGVFAFLGKNASSLKPMRHEKAH